MDIENTIKLALAPTLAEIKGLNARIDKIEKNKPATAAVSSMQVSLDPAQAAVFAASVQQFSTAAGELGKGLGRGVGEGVMGRERKTLTSLEFTEELLNGSDAATLRDSSKTLRKAAIAKMTYLEYAQDLAATYGPSVVAGIVATLAAQWGYSWYSQRGLVGLEGAHEAMGAEGLSLAV